MIFQHVVIMWIDLIGSHIDHLKHLSLLSGEDTELFSSSYLEKLHTVCYSYTLGGRTLELLLPSDYDVV